MSRFKNRLVKRVMAVILSGAMVMTNMTAFASEAPDNTGGGYISEVEDVDQENSEDIETAKNDDAANNETTADSSNGETISEDDDNGSSNEKEDNGDVKDETEVTAGEDKADGSETSEAEDSLSTETEDVEEEQIASEDLKAVTPDSSYKAPTTGSTKWSTYFDVFQPTVFGGSVSVDTTNNKLEKDAYGNMRVAVLNNKGKITQTSDGRTMYYYQINATDTFELTATAKINSIAKHNQAGFGLMVRDDMYIDAKDKGGVTDYAVAGALGDGQVNNFYRKDGTLDVSNKGLSENVKAGDTYKLSISYDGTKYVSKLQKGSEAELVNEYELNLACNDTNYRYVGMFAARQADITYSDICLTVAGTSVFAQKDLELTKYAVTVESNGNGTAKASATEAIESGVVTLTATPDRGYYLKEWQVQTGEGLNSVTIKNNEFTMPKGAVSIKAIFQEFPKEWSFRADGGLMKGSGKELNQVSGSVINLEALEIDTTGKGAKFHTDRDNGAQVNQGTKIKIPMLGPSKVTIEGYNIYTSYTIDGVQNKDYVQTQTFKCEGTDDYATLVMLPTLPWREGDSGYGTTDSPNGEYLYSIKVEPIIEDEKPRTEWDFQNDATIAGTEIKGDGDNVTYEGNGVELYRTTGIVAGLEIDATNGKWDSRGSLTSGWVQVNNNTTITVPVEGACRVSIVAYDANYKVNGEAAKEAEQSFIYKGEDQQVVIVATANTYLRSIKVEPLTYVANGLTEFYKITGLSENDIPDIDGIAFENIVWHDNQHGLVTKAAASTMRLTLSEKANVTVLVCTAYGTGANGEPSVSVSGTSIKPTELQGASDGVQFKITEAAAGDLTLTINNGVYIHSIEVEYLQDVVVPTGPRKIDVWDFGGKVETDTEKYTNHITPKLWLDSDLLIPSTEDSNKKGRFRGSNKASFSYDIDDLTMYYVGEDRLYSDISDLTTIVAGSSGNGSNNKYADGYTAAGGWYGGGSGSSNTSDLTKSDTRNMVLNNVLAGDIIVLYAGQHMKGDTPFGPITFHFEGQGTAAGQDDTSSTLTEGRIYTKSVFIAEKSGSYKIWPDCENSGKPMYNRVMRIPGVKVSGTINFNNFNIGSDYIVKFINQSTKQEFGVEVNENGSFEVALAPGYTYMAALVNAPGYDFASTEKFVTIAENSSGETVNLSIVQTDRYDYTGNIAGFEEGYDISRLTITMVPPADAIANEVELEIDKETKRFTAQLDSGLEYTLRMEGVDDYILKTPEKVQNTSDTEEDMVVERKPRYLVSGGFIGLENATIQELKFTLLNEKGNPDTNYVYTVENLKSGSYSIELRNGAYLASAKVDGYSTQTHVVVEGKAVTKDLYFVSTANGPLERVPDLYVGYPNKGDANYKTVSDAVKAAKRMNPQSEAERITIHIAPGTYREQIIVEASYITFTNDEAPEEVILTWYYGIGYEYYSAGSGGFYNEEKAHDKYEKNEVDRWGCTVQVKGLDFKAENITFENSFNRYLTAEEIEDGVTPVDQGKDTKPVRNKKLDVSSKEATERAAVLFIENCKTKDADGNEVRLNRAEFYKCTFLSSQDTLGTGSGNVYSYYKDCVIEGNTDYICGDGDAVFDNCELRFGGYTGSTGAGGYITAPKAPINHGYLFWDCTITGKDAIDDSFIVDPGYLGRPWGATAASATFINTKLQRSDIVIPIGWGEMQNTKPENANFKEYGTVLMDGTAADTSERAAGTVKTEQPVESMSVYFDDWKWTPSYADYDESKVVKPPVSTEKRSDVPTGTTTKLTCSTEGASIYYTMDGTEPTENSTLYNDGDEISLGDEEKEVVIKAIAIKGNAASKVATFKYTVKDAQNLILAPEADVEPGEVEKGTEVKLKCDTNGAAIYYTTNGDEPKVDPGMLYRGQSIIVNEAMTIKAISEKDGNISKLSTFEYTVKAPVVVPDTVAKPTASPASGTLPKGATVVLDCEDGAEIYYTKDGKDPKTDGELYVKGTPISLGDEAKTIIIKAVAKKGTVYSKVVEFTYTISADIDPDKFVNPPAFSKAEGPVKKGDKVTISCQTLEADIYFTTDGSEPKAEEKFLYTKGMEITIDKTMTIRAIAVKNGNTSEESKVTYTVEETEDPKPPVDPVEPVKTIKLEECTITIPSIMESTKKGWKPQSVTYVTYEYKDENGNTKYVKFAEDLDYTVDWTPGKQADGSYKAVLTGCGRSTDERSVDGFVIDPKSTKDAFYMVYAKPKKGDSTKIVDLSKAKVSLKDVKNLCYTGYAHQPELDYTKDKDELEGKLNIAYKNNINAGKASVIISAKPNVDTDAVKYVGSKTLTFTIKKAAFNKDENKAQAIVEWDSSFDFSAAQDYTGKPVEVKGLKVKTKAGKLLQKDEDYTVTYKNNAKAGKAAVTVKGIGNNLSGSWSNTFTINPVSLDNLALDKVTAKLPYSPKGAKITGFTAKSTDGNTIYTLREGVDYTAKYVYSDNKTKAPDTTVTVTISGKGAFTGKNKQLGTADGFQIVKADFEKDITVAGDVVLDAAIAATGDSNKIQKAIEKVLVVSDASGVKFKANKDYKVTIIPTTETATGKTLKLEPLGNNAANYTGEKVVSYRVATNLAKDKNFAFDKTLDKNDPMAYDGRNPVRLRTEDIDKYINKMEKTDPDYANRPYRLGGENANIEIVPGTYKNNFKKGTAQVTVRGIAGVDGGFYGTKVLKFKIVEK